MAPDLLREALDRAARPLRGLRGLARIILGVAAAILLLAVVAWLLRTGWLAAPQWIVAAWCGVILFVVAGIIVGRRAIAALGVWQVGSDLEASGIWRHGALTTVLELPVAGVSAELHAAAGALRAAEVTVRAPALLESASRRERRRGRWAIGALAVGAIGLVAARPATGAVAALWNPALALHALVAPVQLRARQTVVARGAVAVLDVRVIGHRTATLYTRAPGEVWHTAAVALDENGSAVITTRPLTAELVARVEAGGRHSVEVHVAVRLAAFLGAFTATAHYPGYLGLDDEALPTTGDTLVLPEGTRLSLAGRATTPLSTALLHGTAGDVNLIVDGATFHADWIPRVSGSWQLHVLPAAGGSLDGELPTLPIRVVADSAPVVEIPVPGADTVAAPSLRLALVVSIRDDHGITAAAVDTRRGANGSLVHIVVPVSGTTGDRALITTSLDLAALGLHPGDTLYYTATAQDNAPVRHTGRSREFIVRIPTEAEQRAARARETADAVTGFDSLSRQAAQAQRTEEDLARERQRSDTPSPSSKAGSDGSQNDPLASESARKAQAAVQAEQHVIDDATRLQQSVQQLRDAAQREGAGDSTLARELNDIAKLLDHALSPALRDKLAALQQAVKDLDADRTTASMADLAKQQEQLKEALDQARELFKRAALESDLANLGQDARQLAAEQKAAVPGLSAADSSGARTEQEIARRTDSLAAGLQRAASQVASPTQREGFQQLAQQAQQAAASMQQAAKASRGSQPTQAQQQGKQGEEQIDPLPKKIDEQRESMQAQMRQEVSRLLERALVETSNLADNQLAVVGALQLGALLPETRSSEGLVEEGTAKVLQQISVVSAMNALVSPQAGVALATARQLMLDAITAVSNVNPNTRTALEKAEDATDALAVAAFALLQSRDKVNGSQSGSGVQEAMEQMQQMAGQQGQLAQQGAGMMQPGGVNAQQLMQLALQQRALAQRLDRLRAGGQLPGAGQMAREAKDLSQAMQAGRLNQDVVERQQQLFHKMLDAGRTLQGQNDDDTKERQSTTAKDAPPAIPAALDPRILNGTGEIRAPSWETLQRLAPEERRRVVDYFQRLTQVPSP